MVFTASTPEITAIRACEILSEYWGIKGRVQFLTSERDQNILVATDGGSRYILKVSHPDEDRMVSNLQTTALLHIMSGDPHLPVPQIIPTLKGEAEFFISLPDGQESMVRLMSFLEGSHVQIADVSPEMAEHIGYTAGRLDIALSDCEHPAGNHDFLWDTRKLVELSSFLDCIEDEEKRSLTGHFVDVLCTDILPRLASLPQQLIHNDLNLGNMLFTDNSVSGIIDFGDMLRAQRVIDPANACAYLAVNADDPFRLSRTMAYKYIEANPLTSEEKEILPYLIIGRCLVTILVTNWRASIHPHQAGRILRHEPNAYALVKNLESFQHNLSDFFWENHNV
ncbi:phosphotransferase [Desulforhopalus singaporensis]|uniref:Hydroxylysine kinase n=1 Tax=Desulforhopalus singaporensis TaxID=91360 RepID=A0A1H0SL11_9BACT|nr:phosphotransferase [Desulforhopalus singaporensis]SDP42522.1 Ser/Thr protein kinase RdoA involved in Cpx stress response, MazF antagonist [Desulforhopalus singaporensis]